MSTHYYLNALDNTLLVQWQTDDLIVHTGAGDDFVRTGEGDDILDDSVSGPMWSLDPEDGLILLPYIGRGGDDTFFGGWGRDTLRGYRGADDLFGEEDNDRLDGGNGRDLLAGGSEDDTLIGGSGADTLVGGEGDDRFDYYQTSESRPGQSDIIYGFGVVGPPAYVSGELVGDRIYLRPIDAVEGTGTNDFFTFAGETSDAAGLAMGAGTLWVRDGGDAETLVRGNTDTDDEIELSIRIQDGATDADVYHSLDFWL